jgi:hypothetical protein
LYFNTLAVAILLAGKSFSIRHSGGSRNLGRFMRKQKANLDAGVRRHDGLRFAGRREILTIPKYT